MPSRIAIASNGLGRGPIGGHHLSTKFEAAADAGFDGIEVCCMHERSMSAVDMHCRHSLLGSASRTMPRASGLLPTTRTRRFEQRRQTSGS